MSSATGVTMLVIPNVMGITIYSPPLNRIKNSVRGVQFCQELIERYQFHRYIKIKLIISVNMNYDM